jgi:hypothetical protein
MPKAIEFKAAIATAIPALGIDRALLGSAL